MKTLFNIDIRNYDDAWPHSKRPSARGVILLNEGESSCTGDTKVVMVYSKKYGYYKFPGGGIHNDEDNVTALIREVSEEVGLSVIPESVKEYGMVHRLQKSNYLENTIFEQDSFYYFCSVNGLATGEQNLDPYEAEAGFELRIVPIKDVIFANTKLQNDNDPFSLLMVIRDTRVLCMLSGESFEIPRTIAEYLLEEANVKNPGPWKMHSYAVAKASEKVAKAINAAGGKMDVDKAYTNGLLHDIGRQEGFTYMAHVWDGYEYLMSLGFESAARVCITHSFNLQIVDDYIGKRDLPEETISKIQQLLSSYVYDDYDRLIQLLDSTCAADGTQDLEIRMNDVKTRYGYYPEPKWNKNFELKEYFEKLMKRDLYSVIGEE